LSLTTTDPKKAAGTLSYLIEHALPALAASLPKQNKALETVLPADLNTFFLKSLHFLMLAQAQECFWQTAVIGT
jgi:programmed cell death 6-interacting protein